jgi:XTP/dITP diphosphohydrolase
MQIQFVSSNEHKIREVKAILNPVGIDVIASPIKIDEIQTEDVKSLVHDKLHKAFARIGRPVFVEHTGLHLPALNGFPGGLTQIFWDRVQADLFARLVNGLGDNAVTAKTVIGYCDARTVHFFSGEVEGTVPSTPIGNRDFQWDCVFVPKGYTQTFAELGPAKNDISMRRKALDEFSVYLKSAK